MAPAVAGVDYRVAFFDLAEYNEAFRSFLDSAMHGLSTMKDPILGQISRARFRRTYRGRNSVDPVAATAVETPMMESRNTFGIDHATIVGFNITKLLGDIDNLAEQYAAVVVPQIFAGISTVTDAFGNTKDAEGKPFSWDMVLDMFEGMEFAFDENDQPIMPGLHVGLDFKAPPMTVEQQAKLEDICERKRVAHVAGRRHRQLPRNPLGV